MRLQDLATYAAAFLFAALAPALLYSLAGGSYQLLPLTLTVTLAHALVLGLPLFLIVRRTGWVNVFSATAGGFLIGAIPIGLMSWPLTWTRGSNVSIEGVPTVIDGVPT